MPGAPALADRFLGGPVALQESTESPGRILHESHSLDSLRGGDIGDLGFRIQGLGFRVWGGFRI